MRRILLGYDRDTKKPIYIPKNAFRTHFHIPGGTGKGKTTALLAMLHQLLRDPTDRACHIIVDFLGGLSFELGLWLASRYCLPSVRERLVYIEPAREGVVLGMNPLLYETEAHGFYKTNRAAELVLRGWEMQNTEAMPRLSRWLFNAFWAAAQLGLTISDCVHFLMPGSVYHKELLRRLPPLLRAEWEEIMKANSTEASRILEAARNRLKPYFESPPLRYMFGATHNRFDVLRFMQEGRIVVLNLAPNNRIPPQVANAIGGLVLNEVLATARSLPRHIRYPTYLWLDEFQRMVGKDIELAIPEVRQLALRLILSHQSFAQLKRGDCDLTSIIFTAQSRMVFGLQGEDADLLADEFATIEFDDRRIKDEIYTLRQLHAGHKICELSSWGTAETMAQQWNETYGQNWSANRSTSRRDMTMHPVRGEGSSEGHQEGHGQGGSQGRTQSSSTHQQLVPQFKETMELARRTYSDFREQRQLWAKKLRTLHTGATVLRLVDDDTLYDVDVKASRPGFLGFDVDVIYRRFPQVIDAYEQMIEANFASDFFASPAVIERETQERLDRVLRPVITVDSAPKRIGSEPPPLKNPLM